VSAQLHDPAPGTYWIGGWVDLTAGLDDMEKSKFLILPDNELRPLNNPARYQSLYRLRYRASIQHLKENKNKNSTEYNL
jgi:hypothetical protein